MVAILKLSKLYLVIQCCSAFKPKQQQEIENVNQTELESREVKAKL